MNDKQREQARRVWDEIGKLGPHYGSYINFPRYFFPNPARFQDKGTCQQLIKNLNKQDAAAQKLRNALKSMPHIAESDLPLNIQVIDEHIAKIRTIESEAKYEIEKYFGKGSGRGKNIRAYFVAEEIARRYVFATGIRPTVGHNDGKPSTPFCRTVKEVFSILEIKADFRDPCGAATNAMTPEAVAQIASVRGYQHAVARRVNEGAAKERS